MRLRTSALLAVAAFGFLTACSGDDEDAAPSATTTVDATAAPTATPLTSIPDAILVTGSGLPGGGGTSTEEAAEYVVEAGDTLGAIAQRFGVDLDLIREANDLSDDFLSEGQTLVIPRGGTLPPDDDDDDDDDGPQTPTTPSDGTYIVQEGDTAFGIALEFDTTVEALAAANGMTEDEITNLQIGQEINVPTPE